MRADELRPIPGYEGLYSASVDGRIWSHARFMNPSIGSTPRLLRGRWLKPSLDHWGYAIVVLMLAGKRRNVKVHRAVALAWLPNPDSKPCVNHLDGEKRNNAPSNLEWCTVGENNAHAVRTGLNTIPEGRRFVKVNRHSGARA